MKMNTSNKKIAELSILKTENDATRINLMVSTKMAGLGAASVLTKQDSQYEFFDELKEEILKKKCDKIDKRFYHYPKLEMYKLIFKLTSMELEFIPKNMHAAYIAAKKKSEEDKEKA